MKLKFHVVCVICNIPVPFLSSFEYFISGTSSRGLTCASCGATLAVKGNIKRAALIGFIPFILSQFIFAKFLFAYLGPIDLGIFFYLWFAAFVLGAILSMWFACINMLEFTTK